MLTCPDYALQGRPGEKRKTAQRGTKATRACSMQTSGTEEDRL